MHMHESIIEPVGCYVWMSYTKLWLLRVWNASSQLLVVVPVATVNSRQHRIKTSAQWRELSQKTVWQLLVSNADSINQHSKISNLYYRSSLCSYGMAVMPSCHVYSLLAEQLNKSSYAWSIGSHLYMSVCAFVRRYMFNEVLTAEQRERTHIFNTFFYGQLTKENRDTASGLRFASSYNIHIS